MISAVGVYYNCIETIESVLQHNLRFVDEFIAIDQGSTDGTSEILKKYTDYYEKVENKGFCEYHRDYVINKSSCDWILWLDGDEYFSPDAQNFIKNEFIHQNTYDELRFRRLTFVQDKRIQDELGIAPRFWRKEGITYNPVIHSQPIGLKNQLTRNDLIITHQQTSKEKIMSKLNKYDEVCDKLVENKLIDEGTSKNFKGLANAARERSNKI